MNSLLNKVSLLFFKLLVAATLLGGSLQAEAEARNLPNHIISKRTSVQQFENAAVTIEVLVTEIEVFCVNRES